MRTSEVLMKLASSPGERLSVAAIFSSLGDKGFALLIVILGLPNCVPLMPPPIPLICGFLLIGVALQIGLGRKSPWAPAFVLARSVAQQDVRKAAEKAMPLVRKMERFSKPRLQWFEPGIANLLIALVVAVLALGVITAAPFIGQVPWGLAVCLMGLGLVERDGVLVIASVIAAVFAAFLSAGFVYAVFVGVKSWFF
jgi:hypothetical protein